jgi:hypothetical protein
MGKRSRWMREVSAVRRSFAHPYGLHYDVLTNLDTYVAICYSLQWFMSVFMLSEAGIDHETIRTALANSNQYQIFLQNARKWLPYVYER